GDASTHLSRLRHVRARAAESERRTAAPDRAVEVRLQGLQVDRRHQPRPDRAPDELEHRRAERVRLLLERQSGGRPSAVEPEDRTPHRRVPPPRDAAVQRLRRAGRRALRGDGPEEILLMAPRQRVIGKTLVLVAGLIPVTWLAVATWHDALGANPIE